MRTRIALLCLALSFIAWAQNSSPSQNTSTGPAVCLPLRRIVLYKNGIGYFEHAGRVRGNEDANIDLTTAQLNDVLKSLTVVDRDKGRITFVSYNSTAPVERQLDSLRLRVGGDPTTVQFLEALRGVRLEVRSGSQAVSGRLLSIDQRELPTKDGDKITTHQLSIVSDAGEVMLDGGSFSVLEDDTFAGEGLMDLIKPGERRLLSYATDLGVLVEAKRKSEKQRFTNVIIAHGTMTEISEEREEQVYIVRSRDIRGRTVVIEHPARQGWNFAEGPEPTESSVSFHRFRVTVEPHKTVALHIKEYRPISTRYQLTAISDADIDFFLSQAAINPALEKVLRQVSSQKNTVAGLDAEINARKTLVSNIAEDQQRVRENMKALKGSAEEKTLVERYARELNDQEDRVQSLERDIADLRQKRDAAQKALSDMLVGLEFEAQL